MAGMQPQAAALRIGISGWRYPPWRGVFYPDGLAQKDELAYASRQLPTIELNGSFYSLQTPGRYAAWYAATPAGFTFSIKAPRYVTHVLRLRDVRLPLANFFASGLLRLDDKLGPILWQLPPSLPFSAASIEAFLALLPHDTQAAQRLARRCEPRMRGRASFAIDRCRPLRHALEVRHHSFADPAFVALLRRHGVALVVADTAGKWPSLEDVTADFMSLRLHGDKAIYRSGYTKPALLRWAARIRAWASGAEPAHARRVCDHPGPAAPWRDVYCYFDNDMKVRAPTDARTLMRLLRLPMAPVDGSSHLAGSAP